MIVAHQVLCHEFVEFIPSSVEDGILYVSIPYATAVHRCCCGCRAEIVTPLTPTDWTLLYDGETVSLDRSVGSWNLPCKSHYWIRRNEVRWSVAWSKKDIAAGKERDQRAKQAYYGAAVHERGKSPSENEKRHAASDILSDY